MHVTELCMQVCECVWRDVAEDPCRHNAKTSGPRGSPGTVNVKLFTHCPAPPGPSLHWRRDAAPPPPRSRGASRCRHRNVLRQTLVSVAFVTGHGVFPARACPSSQPWTSGRAGSHSERVCPSPFRADDGGAAAASRCPCPCPSEEVDGAVRFLKFCTKFSFVIKSPPFLLND